MWVRNALVFKANSFASRSFPERFRSGEAIRGGSAAKGWTCGVIDSGISEWRLPGIG